MISRTGITEPHSNASPIWRRFWPALAGYLFAAAANLAALGLTYALEPVIAPSPFPIFVGATALATWFFGVGVGLFSSLVAILVTNFFFMPPLFILTLGKEDVSRLGVFLLVTAITISMMRAQKVAGEARARLGAIVAFSDDAIIGVTKDGVITSWNAGAQRIYGYSPHEMLGRSLLEIVPRERQDEMRTILAQVRRGEPTRQHETVHFQKSGQRINASITFSPIRDEAGGISGAALIARDITGSKRAETELRESQKQLQESTDQLRLMSRRLVEGGRKANASRSPASSTMRSARRLPGCSSSWRSCPSCPRRSPAKRSNRRRVW